MSEPGGLEDLARRAAEAALGAGAGDAEAYGRGIAQPRGPRPRRRGREPDRGDRQRGRGPGLDRGAGRLRLRDRSLRRRAGRARRGRGRRGPGRRRGRVRGRPGARRRRRRDRRPPRRRSRLDRDGGGDRPGEAGRAGGARPRRAGHRGRAGRLRRRGPSAAIASSRGVAASVRGLGRLRLPAGDGDAGLRGRRPGSASGWPARRAASTPRRSAREGGDEASSMIGATQAGVAHLPRRPRSDRSPPASSASSAGRSAPTTSSAGARRSPTGSASELASEACDSPTTGSTRAGSPVPPSTARATPRGRTPLIEDGRLLAYLHDTYTARRGGAVSTGNAARAGYRSPPSVSTSNLVVDPGELSLEELLERGRRGRLRHRRRRPALGRQPGHRRFSVGASGGRSAAASSPSRCASSRSPAICSARSRAVQAVGSEARWVPFGGSVQHARRCSSARWRSAGPEPSACLRAEAAVRLGAHFNPEEDDDVTKAEFLDVLARDEQDRQQEGGGRGRRRGARRDHRRPPGRRRGQLHRLRQVPVAERGPRQGVNPRTGERITIPGGKVPRFSAGSGLKKKVKGGD